MPIAYVSFIKNILKLKSLYNKKQVQTYSITFVISHDFCCENFHLANFTKGTKDVVWYLPPPPHTKCQVSLAPQVTLGL